MGLTCKFCSSRIGGGPIGNRHGQQRAEEKKTLQYCNDVSGRSCVHSGAQRRTAELVPGRHVAGRMGGAFPEKVLFHLLQQELLSFRRAQV